MRGQMIGWHHRLNGHEFELGPGDGERQGCLACCIHGVAKSQTWLSDWTTTKMCQVASVIFDSLWPCGLQPARLFCLCDSPGENTGVGCHSALQGIFPTRGLNLSITSLGLAGDCLNMIYLRNATSKMVCFPVNGFSYVLGGSDSKESVCNAGDLC